MFDKKLTSYLQKKNTELPFRSELFNQEQLGEYAKVLAGVQTIGKGDKIHSLRKRLDDNEAKLQQYNREVLSLKKVQYLTPATEWLVDNFYLVEEHIQLARRHFPKSYSKELPYLTDGPYKGFPRVYGIAAEITSHVDAQLDDESLRIFFTAYQEVAVLKLGELWAIPIMLRLVLIENLRRIVTRLQQDHKERNLANFWMDRVEEVGASTPSALVEVISDMAKVGLPMSSAFVSEFSKRLSVQNPSYKIVKNWFEQRLRDEGLSVEELVHTENQSQAADQLSVSHTIKSLRFIASNDWKELVERVSAVEKILREDPENIYAVMDFASRDHYRHAVEHLAAEGEVPEKEVARYAVELSEDASQKKRKRRECHVGYYLIGEGLEQLKKRVGIRKTSGSRFRSMLEEHALLFYAGTIGLLALLGTLLFVHIARGAGVPAGSTLLMVMAICFLVLVSQLAIFIVNYVASLLMRPDFLPRLDFSEGVPYAYRTIFVVPTILVSREGIDKLVSDLELHYLSNPDSYLYFALLTDFADADRETEAEDALLLEYIRAGIGRLNQTYCPVENRLFYLFHRSRSWNPEEKKWMGYERKRGKLMEFNRFLKTGSTAGFAVTEGDVSVLPGIRYVITLDADTQLPPYSAYKLVGTMAHLLNRPVIDPQRRVVVRGYGILQPRIAIHLKSSQSSLFSRLFTDKVGIDPYTRSVSDVYQDIFHEGSFVGKGIYDVDTFERVLEGRFPANKILSHDLLESAYVRSGLVGDVEIYESYPSGYLADTKRRHRWMRGDWQIIQWLLPRVPLPVGSEPNPLSGLSRWKMTDNLRRSLVAPLTLLFLLTFVIWFPQKAWLGPLLLSVVVLLPFFLSLPMVLLKKPKEETWRLHLLESAHAQWHYLKQLFFSIVVFPYEAWLSADAIVRSLWRLMVSHRNLLQWQTAEEADRTAVNTLGGFYRRMWFSPLFAIACFLWVGKDPVLWVWLSPFIVVWLLAPWIAWMTGRPVKVRKPELTVSEEVFLKKIARKIWYFFETFVQEKENWLPPDNFQEVPNLVIASRTSPTNMGLSLLANLAAYDFGYLSAGGVIDRTEKAFATFARMKKFRGHFYNWYDTRTLEPLHPLYVSTVDSGNLAGDLITLAGGLKELQERPVYDPVLFRGLLDTVRVMRDIHKTDPRLERLEQLLTAASFPEDIPGGVALLRSLEEQITEFNALLEPYEIELVNWGKQLEANCGDHLRELLFLFPWLENSGNIPPLLTEKIPSLRELAGRMPASSPAPETIFTVTEQLPEEWEKALEESSGRARERIKVLEAQISLAERLSEMDFAFLYDKKKKLFTIGYNVPEQQFDASYYDMFASEARLSSYIAIATGQVPLEHWFLMSRLLTLFRGKPVLLSWSGSMFEYLMPLLLMPEFKETLLSSTYKGAVAEQIAYAGKFGVPWGISESGYNRPDTQLNYQYRAFGVPGLGLKRGLSKDLVIAPYATLLALMVDARKAYDNLRRLSSEGHEGDYGYYEAVDYTASHLPLNEKSVNIFSFMAHHQGMGLLSLANLLQGNSMQKRFMASPRMKAFELLLQERVPHSINSSVISDNSELEIEKLKALSSAHNGMNRVYTGKERMPEVNLLSNGRYQLMLNTSGAGYSRWNSVAVTRWREDPTSDGYGFFIYLRDLDTGKYWSATHQPVLQPEKEYEVNFTQAYAEYRQRHSGLDISTTVCISPEDDVELRCVKLSNHTPKTRTIELTSYAEVVIAPQAADEAHTVFSNLFVQTTFDPENGVLYCTRRSRSEEERPPHLFHLVLAEQGKKEEVTFETDRSRFIGRGNTLVRPDAMTSREPLSGTSGSVLDPIVSLRRKVRILPGQSVRVCMILGVSDTQEGVWELAGKYQNVRMTDRAFELAWTHSQVVLYHLNLKEQEAQLYQRLAGSLVYMNPALRADPAILKNNKRGQNGLWGYGISGDFPMVVVRVASSSGKELVRQLVMAHAYWRTKGLIVELVILNEDLSVYRQPLHDELVNMITTGIEAPLLDKSGGIFVRPADQLPAEDLILLQSAASVVFTDGSGTLQEQVERGKIATPLLSGLEVLPVKMIAQEKFSPVENLVFNNGYGGFTRDGKEYVITVLPGKSTPAPWSNVLANSNFGTLVSESGGAYTWLENSHEFRLTPWYNDPVKDTSGEALYIRDEETGHYWSPTPLPARGVTPYVVRHGFGYTLFEHTENGIASELRIYVAAEDPVKFSVLKLRNLSGKRRVLSFTGYCEWVLGDSRTRNLLHVQTATDVKRGTLFARNFYNTDFPGKIAFMDMGNVRTVTGDRREFLGVDGTLAAPLALSRKRLSGKTGAGFDPCGAVQVMIELYPGSEKEVTLLVGCAADEQHMAALVDRYRLPGETGRALEQVKGYWDRLLGAIRVETPDLSVNTMANGWLLYQTLASRIWARTGYYQSGGAYGFRDQLQDVMALSYCEPVIAREQILRAARHQFRKGDVQHWWHPPLGRGIRTLFSDDYLWLPYVTYHYITTSGDTGILEEVIPFLEGRELQPGEESYYDLPLVSEETATLYEHCVRSVRYGLKFGVHGLPLMGCGDWNDGMNLVGIQGKGESVWLAFFLYDVLVKFSELARDHGDTAFAGECTEQARLLQENIRKNSWDGNWYLRAFFDDGTPLGSSRSSECTIDALPQSWSVISGAGDPERSRMGMEKVDEMLVDRSLKMIRLFRPPFDRFLPSPGYIKGYIPGVRENGGQYTHGVIWTAWAFALMGETDRAWELFDLLNPVNHGATEKEIEVYKVEPYVVAADIYSAVQHPGRGGWTWYTGSSAWMYRLLVEMLFGIRRTGTQLRLVPKMRRVWDSYSVDYRYYDTVYHILFRRANEESSAGLLVDGNRVADGQTLLLVNDAKEHTVEMWVV